MANFKVTGERKLGGTVSIGGAKNAVLPILAASSMISGEVILHNCPLLSDVENTLKILKYIGAEVKREGSTLIINSNSVSKSYVPEKYMRLMRSSVLFLGALSSRTGSSRMSLPGGCNIGLRPIDLHLKALADLSAVISYDGKEVCCNAEKSRSADLVLPYPSVGATENAILFSVFLKGKTRIINAAREPEIYDLCSFLNKAGARISGASGSVIEIEGVKKLRPLEYTVMPDRVTAVTFLCIAASTKSALELKNVDYTCFKSELCALMNMGCKLYLSEKSVAIKPSKLKRVKSIATNPYPGFSTDCQPLIASALIKAKGVSEIKEAVFENRFEYAKELIKFGADINVINNKAVIKGVERLSAANVECKDLRGGAALVTAALSAEGTSYINNIDYIDRGYERLEVQLSNIGADIMRIKNEEKRK